MRRVLGRSSLFAVMLALLLSLVPLAGVSAEDDPDCLYVYGEARTVVRENNGGSPTSYFQNYEVVICYNNDGIIKSLEMNGDGEGLSTGEVDVKANDNNWKISGANGAKPIFTLREANGNARLGMPPAGAPGQFQPGTKIYAYIDYNAESLRILIDGKACRNGICKLFKTEFESYDDVPS